MRFTPSAGNNPLPVTSSPGSQYGLLICIGYNIIDRMNLVQFACQYNFEQGGNTHIYIRVKADKGNWSSWRTI